MDPKTTTLEAAESADDILSIEDAEILAVEVPEWKRTIHLRTLPADEGLKLTEELQALPKEKGHEAMFMLLAATIVDSKGKRLFTSDAQKEKLRTRNNKVLQRLNTAALVLQGWRKDDQASPKND